MDHAGPPMLDDGVLEEVTARVAAAFDHRTGVVFADAMRRTLDDAVLLEPDGTGFVLTGDIPAMWLRDSAAQMRPYLALLGLDPRLGDVVAALVRRQSRQILQDPYANAFNRGPDGAGHQSDDTDMAPEVWERKYEVDSLAYPLQLAHQLWQATGRTDHLDGAFRDAAALVVATLRTEQDHAARSSYRFQRFDGAPTDTLTHGGHGSPVGVTGMTWSAFRPSDDACVHHYNVPGNLFAAASLRDLAELARGPLPDPDLAADADALAAELDDATRRHGVVDHPRHGPVLAYEVDGLGHHLLMDDANMPSLLSLPLTGGIALDDPLYVATRRFVLSEDNPTYTRGTTGDGLASPHTPDRYVWPLAAAVRGLTSTDPARKRAVVADLLAVNAERGRMCESYHVDRPEQFTREWFSWADSMFCELVLDVIGYHVPGAPGAEVFRHAA
ncbi:glycoside hydrolase family 125 protein [Isoptericola sp. NPDC057559]|uniref:glycoside hydrolase family 125 protein n=1 Tax=Isoptericola sp. NPDC057559 TaxID=3346168 RepID=UPI003679B34B